MMAQESRSEQEGIVGCLVRFDYLLFLFILLTTAFGILTLYGTTHGVELRDYMAPEQAERWGISVVVFFLAALIPYRWLKSLGWPLYFFIIGLLSLLVFCSFQDPKWSLGGFVVTEKGATSWIQIPGIPQIQPSEFAKIAVVIVLSQWLAWRREKLISVWECMIPFTLVALPMFLITLQPDVGTACFFLPLPFILLFLAGLRWRIIMGGILLGIPALIALLVFLATVESLPDRFAHGQKRIVSFRESIGETLAPVLNPFNPPSVEEVLHGSQEKEPLPESEEEKKERIKKWNADHQVRMGEMALGSGRILGNGFSKGRISRLKFLPHPYNDFIYSSLGEQFGLVGCMVLVGLYLLIAWRVLHIALTTSDPFGKYLVVGLVSIVLLQAFVNIAVVLRLLPVTGVPLPFVSHGGSFLVTCYLIFGLIANVSMRR